MIAVLESRVRKPVRRRKLKIRRAAGCAAEPGGVPRPNPQNSSYWSGTSRRGARIFERPGLRLLYPRKVSNRQRKYGLFHGFRRYPRATFQ